MCHKSVVLPGTRQEPLTRRTTRDLAFATNKSCINTISCLFIVKKQKQNFLYYLFCFGNKETDIEVTCEVFQFFHFTQNSGLTLLVLKDNQVNTVAADVLAPWGVRSSATTQDKEALVCHEEGIKLFHLSAKMIETAEYIFMFPQNNSGYNGLTDWMKSTNATSHDEHTAKFYLIKVVILCDNQDTINYTKKSLPSFIPLTRCGLVMS